MATLMIDDVRKPDFVRLTDDGPVSVQVDKVCRTYDEGLSALKSQKWDVLLLDHDLGDPDPKKTGYGIMCWIEANPDQKPGEIVLITANVVGRKNMEMVIKKLYNSPDSG